MVEIFNLQKLFADIIAKAVLRRSEPFALEVPRDAVEGPRPTHTTNHQAPSQGVELACLPLTQNPIHQQVLPVVTPKCILPSCFFILTAAPRMTCHHLLHEQLQRFHSAAHLVSISYHFHPLNPLPHVHQVDYFLKYKSDMIKDKPFRLYNL